MTKESKEFISSVVKHLALTDPEERNELSVQIAFTCALYGAETVSESYEILDGSRTLIDEAVTAMKLAQSEEQDDDETETDSVSAIRESVTHAIE